MSALVQDFAVTVPITESNQHLVADIAREREAVEEFRCNSRSLMELGEKLFRLAFPRSDSVMNLANELATAARSSATLRLWIRAEDSAVAALPWEYLCLPADAVESCKLCGLKIEKHQPHTSLPDDRTFLSLHPNVSVVRQCGEVEAGGELARISKLKVLVVWAQPNSRLWGPVAGLDGEVTTIQRALNELPRSHVEVEVIGNATTEALRKRIAEFSPHVLHYCGHGAFPVPGLTGPGMPTEPSLVLEGAHPANEQVGVPASAGLRRDLTPRPAEAGTPTSQHTASERQHEYLGGAELRRLCASGGVQVVVLNCCLGAKSSGRVASLAQMLTAPGDGPPVPVVVAHQMEVPQSAAAGFARPFYQNLAIGCPVEEGVKRFRRECVGTHPNGAGAPDWGIPVVHLGTRKTHLFRYSRVDLYPLDFGELIREHVPIVGRLFVKQAIRKFLSERDSGVFLLTAPPGIGKTALVAQLCEDDPTSAAFFYRAAAGMTDPDEWVKSTYHGLLGRYGLREENPTNLQTELRTRLKEWLLPEVSKHCAKVGRRELILLDGLDESGTAAVDRKNALEMLPEKLPANVYLLVTSRPGPLAEQCALRRDAYPVYALDPASRDNREDAAGFCVRELRGRVTGTDEGGLERLGTMLAAKAEGNFLVLKLFFGRDSMRGPMTTAEVERESADLSGDVAREYERFFARATGDVKDDREGMKLLNRVLGAFVTARAPVTAEQVCSAFSVDMEDWEWTLLRVGQFLASGGLRQEERGVRTYRIYHETFREFLRKRLATRLKEFHRCWAERAMGWRELEGYERLYALRHVVSHLVGAGR